MLWENCCSSHGMWREEPHQAKLKQAIGVPEGRIDITEYFLKISCTENERNKPLKSISIFLKMHLDSERPRQRCWAVSFSPRPLGCPLRVYSHDIFSVCVLLWCLFQWQVLRMGVVTRWSQSISCCCNRMSLTDWLLWNYTSLFSVSAGHGANIWQSPPWITRWSSRWAQTKEKTKRAWF